MTSEVHPHIIINKKKLEITSHVPFCPVIHEYSAKENPNGKKLMLETRN